MNERWQVKALEINGPPSLLFMALNFAPSTSLPTASLRFLNRERLPLTKKKKKNYNNAHVKATSSEKQLNPSKSAQPEVVADQEPSIAGPSVRTQLNRLEQLTSSTSPASGSESDVGSPRPTIREHLSQLIGDKDGEFSLPLGKKLKASMNSLTVSQRRNIKRQSYLNKVSGRNDSVFFATIGAFVILPPLVILAVAILTGYVQLFP